MSCYFFLSYSGFLFAFDAKSDKKVTQFPSLIRRLQWKETPIIYGIGHELFGRKAGADIKMWILEEMGVKFSRIHIYKLCLAPGPVPGA